MWMTWAPSSSPPLASWSVLPSLCTCSPCFGKIMSFSLPTEMCAVMLLMLLAMQSSGGVGWWLTCLSYPGPPRTVCLPCRWSSSPHSVHSWSTADACNWRSTNVTVLLSASESCILFTNAFTRKMCAVDSKSMRAKNPGIKLSNSARVLRRHQHLSLAVVWQPFPLIGWPSRKWFRKPGSITSLVIADDIKTSIFCLNTAQ